MFTYIKLKNFLSFGEITLDLKQTATSVKNFAAIYGENGSGKSNFVRSITLLCHSLSSFKRAREAEELENLMKMSENKAPIEVLAALVQSGNFLTQISSCRMLDCDEPSEVEYGFLLDGHEGFYKLVFDSQILGESLYWYTGKQRGYLYNISLNNDGNIQKKFWGGLFLNKKIDEEINDEVKKFWGKHTFLGIITEQIQEKNLAYIKENISPYLLNILDVLRNITVISKQSNHQNTGFITRKPENVLQNLKSGKISKKLMPQLERSERILKDFFTQTYADIKDVVYEIEFLENDKIKYQLYVDKMIAGKIRHVNFNNESAGTQQILEIVRMLLGLFCGVTVVYDEIDDGIHDILLNNIISSLMDQMTGQLIITTHNTLLLETINEKNVYVIAVDYLGQKEFKCLDDFAIQKNVNVRLKYLKGLFGGTPYIDGVDYDSIVAELTETQEE